MAKFGFLFGAPGNPGPIILEVIDGLVPNPDKWTQAAFFVDPANSTGHASDDNDGLTPLTPVLTYSIGIVANKWGTVSPTLAQHTVITWLSSWAPALQPDPVICEPVMQGAVLQLVGTLVGVAAGAFVAVTPKARATGQLLDVDLGTGALPGDLVVNTTAGKASVATVYKNVAGTNFAMTQPQTPAPVGPIDSTTPMAEVDTWAPGDTFRIFRQPTVNLVSCNPVPAGFIAPNFPNPLQLLHIHAISADGIPADDNVYLANAMTVAECFFESTVCVTEAADDTNTLLYGCFVTQALIDAAGSSIGVMNGGALFSAFSTSQIPYTIGNDAILDASVGSIIINQTGGGNAFLTNVYLAGTVLFGAPVNVIGAQLWGPGTIDVIGTARMFYGGSAGAAVATFLNLGGLLINGQNRAMAFQPTDPATWHYRAAASLTPTNLDTGFPSANGYNGTAWNPGGGAITNQATP